METLRPPALQVQVPREDEEDEEDGGGRGACSGGGGGGGGSGGSASPGDGGSDGLAWSSSSTPTLRRRRFKMRRMKKLQSERERDGHPQRLEKAGALRRATSKDYLQLPAIEITPSSDEDAATWSNCSTPSASPRRKRFLLRKWLKVRERKEHASESRWV